MQLLCFMPGLLQSQSKEVKYQLFPVSSYIPTIQTQPMRLKARALALIGGILAQLKKGGLLTYYMPGFVSYWKLEMTCGLYHLPWQGLLSAQLRASGQIPYNSTRTCIQKQQSSTTHTFFRYNRCLRQQLPLQFDTNNENEKLS